MATANTIRRLNREFSKARNALQEIDAGRVDHLFADADTKASVRADIKREIMRLMELLLRADPQYEQLANGNWRIRDNVVPFAKP